MFNVILLYILLQEHLTKLYQNSGSRRNIVDAMVIAAEPIQTLLTRFCSLQRNTLVQLRHQPSSLANEPYISLMQSFPSSGSPLTADLPRGCPCKTGTCLLEFTHLRGACQQPLSLTGLQEAILYQPHLHVPGCQRVVPLFIFYSG